jgi:DNA-directed RNA polymerase subunit M/transcription elongation factor TFIIS
LLSFNPVVDAMDKIVVFETYYNPIEANIVKERLIDSGIQCFLTDENIITINPLYTQALGGVKLHMFETDVSVAKGVLQDQDVQVMLADEVADFETDANSISAEMKTDEICPKCGSNHVGYVQATKKRFSVITMLFSLLLMIYPFNAKKIHHCFNCGNEF